MTREQHPCDEVSALSRSRSECEQCSHCVHESCPSPKPSPSRHSSSGPCSAVPRPCRICTCCRRFLPSRQTLTRHLFVTSLQRVEILERRCVPHTAHPSFLRPTAAFVRLFVMCCCCSCCCSRDRATVHRTLHLSGSRLQLSEGKPQSRRALHPTYPVHQSATSGTEPSTRWARLSMSPHAVVSEPRPGPVLLRNQLLTFPSLVPPSRGLLAPERGSIGLSLPHRGTAHCFPVPSSSRPSAATVRRYRLKFASLEGAPLRCRPDTTFMSNARTMHCTGSAPLPSTGYRHGALRNNVMLKKCTDHHVA